MNREINELLFEELEEAHGYFENIINELKESNINFNNDIISIEINSYNIADNALLKMNDALEQYELIKESNKEFFDEENKLIFKYLSLYIVSIIMIGIFAKTLSSEKLNHLWLAMIGIVFGTVNTSMMYSNLSQYRYANKDNRSLMNKVNELREMYDNNFEIARREIHYMYSLNRNLDEDLTNERNYVKKIKDIF